MNRKRTTKGTQGKTLRVCLLLFAAGVVLYSMGAEAAYWERGYMAVGGEAVALLLPFAYLLLRFGRRRPQRRCAHGRTGTHRRGKERRG